ncbi:MAG: [FeFe] hydrogenase H-cluster maturation GTPase HydF [Clostridiales bacterium]|nr:[FeFe] hydrogenase H-cluster maturation GTPase HydF [Clostridiales bacterium]
MSMNSTPSSERTHIGFFGLRNAGKSSLVNAVTGQDLSVVSDVKGTTTDPVSKAMEILPLGPVVIIDTPGYDDIGELGVKRVAKTKTILKTCDIAVLVVDAASGMKTADEELLSLIKDRGIPYQIVWHKSDLAGTAEMPDGAIAVSSLNRENIDELKERIAHLIPDKKEIPLVSDLVSPGDFCVLVVPIDESAPKGRLILPQQQTIRELLDIGAIPVVTRETELKHTLDNMGVKPALVITDSQAFKIVNEIVPEEIKLTSFSILMARHKGFLETAVRGVKAIKDLQDGDTVLMAEGCTHHRQCNDIGTVKIPNWLRKFTAKDISIETSSGKGYPDDLTQYKAVIHCGGCMLTEAMVDARRRQAEEQGVPFTNYGIVIAYMTGALKRSLEVFPQLKAILEEN